MMAMEICNDFINILYARIYNIHYALCTTMYVIYTLCIHISHFKCYASFTRTRANNELKFSTCVCVYMVDFEFKRMLNTCAV